jgi:hypothetical protein
MNIWIPPSTTWLTPVAVKAAKKAIAIISQP